MKKMKRILIGSFSSQMKGEIMGGIFKRGILAVAPLALTLVLVLWLYQTLEALFKPIVEMIVGKNHYFSGLGIVVALVLIFIVGSIINNWIIQKCTSAFESLLGKIPFVKTLYHSIEEVVNHFRAKEKKQEGQVVVVEILGMKLVGLVTRECFQDVAKGIGEEGDVAVYLPMSYQIGGYTVIVPKSQIRRIGMTMEEGMRFAVTAGVLSKSKKPQDPRHVS